MIDQYCIKTDIWSAESKVEIVLHEVDKYGLSWGSGKHKVGDKVWCILAENESGFNCTVVDLVEVIQWVKYHRPELLENAKIGSFK